MKVMETLVGVLGCCNYRVTKIAILLVSKRGVIRWDPCSMLWTISTEAAHFLKLTEDSSCPDKMDILEGIGFPMNQALSGLLTTRNLYLGRNLSIEGYVNKLFDSAVCSSAVSPVTVGSRFVRSDGFAFAAGNAFP